MCPLVPTYLRFLKILLVFFSFCLFFYFTITICQYSVFYENNWACSDIEIVKLCALRYFADGNLPFKSLPFYKHGDGL